MTLAQVDLQEAVGAGPESVLAVPSLVTLINQDQHSGVYAPMQRNASGLPSYSFERWLRLRFTNEVVYVTTLRFWVPNLEPNPGWSLRMGTADTYQLPTQSRSSIATMPVPFFDPGEQAPNLYPVTGDVATQYSPWLVLQATWDATNDDPFQLASLELSFAWSESQ